jgi:hypothetical protein
MQNLRILPLSLNTHLEFLVANSAVNFYGDADFNVYCATNAEPPQVALRDWAADVCSHRGGWIKDSLRRPIDPSLLIHERRWSLDSILSDCGTGFDALNTHASDDDVLRYLRSAGLAHGRSDSEIDDAVVLMEEDISSESFDPANGEVWALSYQTLQAATPDFTLGEEMQRLWFPLEDDRPTNTLAECLVLHHDGNFRLWACRTPRHSYLISFATS